MPRPSLESVDLSSGLNEDEPIVGGVEVLGEGRRIEPKRDLPPETLNKALALAKKRLPHLSNLSAEALKAQVFSHTMVKLKNGSELAGIVMNNALKFYYDEKMNDIRMSDDHVDRARMLARRAQRGAPGDKRKRIAPGR